MGTSLLLAALSLLCLPIMLEVLGRPHSLAPVAVTGVLMAVNAALPRWTGATRVPGIIICVWLFMGISSVARGPHEGYPYQFFAAVPLLASFLLGARFGLGFTALSVLELCWLDGLVLGRLSPMETWTRISSILVTVLVGTFSAILEAHRTRSERQREATRAQLLAVAKAQAAHAEAQLIHARQARYQALRMDASTALAASGPLGPLLQRCCEAMAHHLDVQLAGIWLLASREGALGLEASAGSVAPGAALARVPVGPTGVGLVARDRQPWLTNGAAGDPRMDRSWALQQGLTAFAACPLALGEQLLGVLAVYSAQPLELDVLAALDAVADTIAQGIERKRAEEALAQHARELARSNEELERFAYVASHDLQEPLRMVASYTQLLGRRYKGKLDADADAFIQFAASGATRMQHLIQDLLAYSRVGTQGGAFAPVDLGEVLTRTLQDLGASIEEARAEVRCDPMPVVNADRGQLGQLFQNLISNALKFRAKDVVPVVHVSAQRREHDWLFTVKDNGIGIDPKHVPRIFVIFQRLHSREEYAGTGLGLAICKKIVERHGGRIWVESVPGHGATFFFTLPLEAEAERPLASSG